LHISTFIPFPFLHACKITVKFFLLHSVFFFDWFLHAFDVLAGMMAIPRAYLQIGSILGTAMLIGVALLIYFTLVVLVHGSAVTGAATYSQLALVTCGRPVMKLLQVAVLAFCFGFGVIYLVGAVWCCSGCIGS
jgi:amino acid permease